MELIKGQKADLTKTNPGLNKLILGVGWNANQGIELDASAFLLGVNGKVLKEEDFIFYGNPTDSNKAVKYSNNSTICAGHTDKQQIIINLSNMPSEIDKIAVTITIYEAEQRKQNFGQVSKLYLHVVDENKGNEIFFFDLVAGLSIENAIVVGEIYRNKEHWKFNATGSGFQGGLASLCTNFGIEVNDKKTPPSPEPMITQVKPTVSTTIIKSEQNSSQESKINLKKIELQKGESINLQKKSGKLGEILVNLNWNQAKGSKGGFLKGIMGSNKGIDLDLGCMYELKSKQKGVVQGLGKSFGNFQGPPYISLDGDDRTGSVTTGENLRINGNHIADFKRILVYTYIYEGSANWVNADGIVTIKQTDGPDIIVKLDEDVRKIMCAIALIENVNDQTFSIKRLVQFYSGHQEMDKAFSWGMRWKTGRKD